MCLDCGCRLAYQSHGDARHIVEPELEEAAAASGISPLKAAENILDTVQSQIADGIHKAAKNAVVSIDIDGTLSLATEALVVALNAKLGRQYTYFDCDETPHWRSLFSDDHDAARWAKTFLSWEFGDHAATIGFYKAMPPDYAAISAVQSLYNAGLTVHISTLRDPHLYSISEWWLKAWGIPYDFLHVGPSSKSDLASELQQSNTPVYFVDDNQDVAKRLSRFDNAHVFLLQRPFTPPNFELPNCEVISTWKPVLDHFGVKIGTVPQLSQPLASTKSKPFRAGGIAVVSQGSGRTLMIQRDNTDKQKKAAGRWEFPGGRCEPGEEVWSAAKREWEEETGNKLPDGELVTHVDTKHNTYRLHVYVIPTESEIHLNPDKDDMEVIDPDHPHAHHTEVMAWFYPDDAATMHKGLRKELRKLDWSIIKDAVDGRDRPKIASTLITKDATTPNSAVASLVETLTSALLHDEQGECSEALAYGNAAVAMSDILKDMVSGTKRQARDTIDGLLDTVNARWAQGETLSSAIRDQVQEALTHLEQVIPPKPNDQVTATSKFEYLGLLAKSYGDPGNTQGRNSLGQFTAGSGGRPSGESLFNTAIKEGGFSVQADGSTPSSGYAVGGQAKDLQIPTSTSPDKAGQQIDAYAKAHSDLLSRSDMVLGGWHNTDSGNVVVKPSRIFSDRATAIAAGIASNQVSIFDIAAGEEISTGGSGEYAAAKFSHLELLLGNRRSPFAYLDTLAKSYGDPGNTQGRDSVGEFTPGDATEKANQNADKTLAAHGVTRDDLASRANSILANSSATTMSKGQYQGMSAQDAGMQWYSNVHDAADVLGKKYGVDGATAACAIAACSPQCPWETRASGKLANMQTAESCIKVASEHPNDDPSSLLSQAKGQGLNGGKIKAMMIVQNSVNNGGSLDKNYADSVLKGCKVRSFASNIIDPSNPYPVTIDGHMANMLLNDWPGIDVQNFVSTPAGYQALSDAIRSAAEENGIAGQQAQATMWMTDIEAGGHSTYGS